MVLRMLALHLKILLPKSENPTKMASYYKHASCKVDKFNVEPRYKERPYNKVLGITNDIASHNAKIYGKEPLIP